MIVRIRPVKERKKLLAKPLPNRFSAREVQEKFEERVKRLISKCEEALDNLTDSNTVEVNVSGEGAEVVEEVIAKYRKARYSARVDPDYSGPAYDRFLVIAIR